MSSADPQQAAQQVFTAFHQTPFAIAGMKDRFYTVASADATVAFSDSAMAIDPGNPTLIGEEIAASIEFFKKIKFKYIEQESKETFLKLMLAEEPLQIDEAENDKLAEENRRSKEKLKRAKTELDQLKEELIKVADEVSSDHDQLTQDIQQAEHFSKEIREIELELSRLRQSVPLVDRMTIDEANEILDNQIIAMQMIADDGDAQVRNVEEAKREVANLMKEVDRLEPERKKDEARVKTAQTSRLTEDGESLRVENICQWYSTQLTTHKDLLCLQSITPGTGPNGKNELNLTYSIPLLSSSNTSGVSGGINHRGRGGQISEVVKEETITLVLIFQPGTNGALLDGTLVNSDMDISELVTEAQRAGDVAGLL
ncbi:hypothetical protein [Phaffia rhodozyma]|uniref:Kinetochore protein Sos7 coiled-coil domain-containing protein n=1 Tax=Phaffia rhodozyma TaxID=264483 RepID=A0A0F7SKB2_PHARH|nr:hypothetical protein [Phaffia rhodozyma]